MVNTSTAPRRPIPNYCNPSPKSSQATVQVPKSNLSNPNKKPPRKVPSKRPSLSDQLASISSSVDSITAGIKKNAGMEEEQVRGGGGRDVR